MSSSSLQFDEIGGWSETKLEILDRYLKEYDRIMRKQRFVTVFVDAFAGPGMNVSRLNGDVVAGSPTIASKYNFSEFHFIDLDADKASYLADQLRARPNTRVYHGDSNKILLSQVFPLIRWDDYRRGVCFLDPYGLTLDWKVVETAGQMKTIDMILNFPVMDMNRNVFWHRPEGVDPRDIERMNAFWGNESWHQVAYKEDWTLFGTEEQKASNFEVAMAYRDRLIEVAGFKEVPRPCPMRNSRGGIIYYLFFASQCKVAHKIMDHIFKRFGAPRPEHE